MEILLSLISISSVSLSVCMETTDVTCRCVEADFLKNESTLPIFEKPALTALEDLISSSCLSFQLHFTEPAQNVFYCKQCRSDDFVFFERREYQICTVDDFSKF